MKNYPKLCISSILEPKGGIYSHQENRGPGDKPWPEAARAPRPYGRGNAAQATFPWPYGGRARGASSRALPFLSPVSSGARFLVCSPWFLQNQLSRSMAIFNRLLITN